MMKMKKMMLASQDCLASERKNKLLRSAFVGQWFDAMPGSSPGQ
ncbi:MULTISPECIES: hypothetical protein [Bradyrhizobium]|nr:hypothetical protein [Bradyrhizobium vignae]